jgi:acetylornithine deacetylase/succinyl-diaminopimelate desuccinylase-like protein
VVETLERTAPLELDPGIRRLTLTAAAEAGIACSEAPSWAGHDAEEFAAVCPAGMIAVRNRGGVSHCPEERADEADIAVGLELLLATLRRVDTAL